MTYLSVCSGIEAATVAWGPLGFKPVGFAEIEPFPCELLKQKYPNVKNYGDITQYENWNIGQFDIWSAEHLASLSVSPETIWELWENIKRNGLYGRMSPEYYPAVKDLILRASSLAWKNAGMGGLTGCLTLNTSEYPNAVVESSLSDILITGQTLPQKYYLSRKACKGILRRAAKNKRSLPSLLEKALIISAEGETTNITEIKKPQH